jgi:hypothetical protein
MLTKKFYYKLKDTLEVLKKPIGSCESCDLIVRHLPAHYPLTGDCSRLVPKDEDVISKCQYSDLERIGVWAGNILRYSVADLNKIWSVLVFAVKHYFTDLGRRSRLLG